MSTAKTFGIAVAGSAVATLVVIPLALWGYHKLTGKK